MKLLTLLTLLTFTHLENPPSNLNLLSFSSISQLTVSKVERARVFTATRLLGTFVNPYAILSFGAIGAYQVADWYFEKENRYAQIDTSVVGKKPNHMMYFYKLSPEEMQRFKKFQYSFQIKNHDLSIFNQYTQSTLCYRRFIKNDSMQLAIPLMETNQRRSIRVEEPSEVLKNLSLGYLKDLTPRSIIVQELIWWVLKTHNDPEWVLTVKDYCFIQCYCNFCYKDWIKDQSLKPGLYYEYNKAIVKHVLGVILNNLKILEPYLQGSSKDVKDIYQNLKKASQILKPLIGFHYTKELEPIVVTSANMHKFIPQNFMGLISDDMLVYTVTKNLLDQFVDAITTPQVLTTVLIVSAVIGPTVFMWLRNESAFKEYVKLQNKKYRDLDASWEIQYQTLYQKYQAFHRDISLIDFLEDFSLPPEERSKVVQLLEQYKLPPLNWFYH